MAQEIGELFVGAYLRKVLGCPIVQYNLRERAGAIVDGATEPTTPNSQSEIDVLGLDFRAKRLYVCEVVTHLSGALYPGKGGQDETVERLTRKLHRHRAIVSREFEAIPNQVFMIWSPYVAAGAKVNGLKQLAAEWPKPNGGLELRINDGYAAAMRELMDMASGDVGHTEEPFYRMFQLLTHLRTAGNRQVRVRIE